MCFKCSVKAREIFLLDLVFLQCDIYSQRHCMYFTEKLNVKLNKKATMDKILKHIIAK